MLTRGGYSIDYEGRVLAYFDDYEGEGTVMITRGGYSNGYEGRVI